MSVGPVMLFILIPINNLPAPTVGTEWSIVRTCSTERFRRENRTRSRCTKTMKRLTACLLGYNQQCGRSAARSCSAERSSLVEREHCKSKKHNNNLYAYSGTSQSNHPPSVFTSNTLGSSDINPSSFALGIYAWTVSCITRKHLWWVAFIYYLHYFLTKCMNKNLNVNGCASHKHPYISSSCMVDATFFCCDSCTDGCVKCSHLWWNSCSFTHISSHYRKRHGRGPHYLCCCFYHIKQQNRSCTSNLLNFH